VRVRTHVINALERFKSGVRRKSTAIDNAFRKLYRSLLMHYDAILILLNALINKRDGSQLFHRK